MLGLFWIINYAKYGWDISIVKGQTHGAMIQSIVRLYPTTKSVSVTHIHKKSLKSRTSWKFGIFCSLNKVRKKQSFASDGIMFQRLNFDFFNFRRMSFVDRLGHELTVKVTRGLFWFLKQAKCHATQTDNSQNKTEFINFIPNTAPIYERIGWARKTQYSKLFLLIIIIFVMGDARNIWNTLSKIVIKFVILISS